MTIFELGALGEFVGAFAVIATLIYLATQIRQNNIIARAQARQALLDTFSAGNWDLARDTELLKSFAACLSRWPDAPDDQKTKFDIGMSRFLTNIQNGLLLCDAGLLDEKVLHQVSDYMVICVLSPAGGRWWKETSMVVPDVREYIERRLADGDTDMLPINESHPYWMDMVVNAPPS